MILRARVVLPVSQPPIENGALLIAGNRIGGVGRWEDLSPTRDKIFDLGDVVLLPGLVNAHCHLDYTDMAGEIPPQKSFTDWIRLMLAAKSGWSYSEFAESWLRGARMLVRTGTTTVGDIEAVPELLPEVWHATPLRVISFLEMTGVKSRRDPRAILHETVHRIDSLPSGRCKAGLSPHAPYSTLPEMLRLSAEIAHQRQWPMTSHVAESEQEFEMFARATGPMFDWLWRNERDMTDCGLGSPVQHVERAGALEKLLAVHVNYLCETDAAVLKRRNVSVAHCPRSHFYFRHRPFPLAELTGARVNICLGTDSLATVRKTRGQTVELNMFEEMHALKTARPGLSAEQILKMATISGAQALGMLGEIGELSWNAFADLIAVPFESSISEVHEAVVTFPGHVGASMIDGQWVIAPKWIYD